MQQNRFAAEPHFYIAEVNIVRVGLVNIGVRLDCRSKAWPKKLSAKPDQQERL